MMRANTAAVVAAAIHTEAKINKWNSRGNKVPFFISSNSSNRMSGPPHISRAAQNKRASFTSILLISRPQFASIFFVLGFAFRFCLIYLNRIAKNSQMDCKIRCCCFWEENRWIIFSYLILFYLSLAWLDAHDFFSFTCRFTWNEMYTRRQRRCFYFPPDFISVGFNYVLNWTLLRCLSIANFHRFDFVCFLFNFLLPTCFHVIFSHDHFAFQWGRLQCTAHKLMCELRTRIVQLLCIQANSL